MEPRLVIFELLNVAQQRYFLPDPRLTRLKRLGLFLRSKPSPTVDNPDFPCSALFQPALVTGGMTHQEVALAVSSLETSLLGWAQLGLFALPVPGIRALPDVRTKLQHVPELGQVFVLDAQDNLILAPDLSLHQIHTIFRMVLRAHNDDFQS